MVRPSPDAVSEALTLQAAQGAPRRTEIAFLPLQSYPPAFKRVVMKSMIGCFHLSVLLVREKKRDGFT